MHISRFVPVSCLVFALGVALALPYAARSQGQLGTKEGLKKAYDEHYKARQELVLGNRAANPKNETDKKIAEAFAQYFLFRTTIKTEAAAAPNDFAKEIRNLMDKKNAKEKLNFIDMLGKECVANIKLVLDRDIKADPSTVVYASQTLIPMGMLKQDDVCAYLIELIENPKTHDVVRLHALKAMREVMPIRTQLDMVLWDAKNEKEDFKDKTQDAKRKHDVSNVDALVKYIERSLPNAQGDELATLRFLRREAIISLAAAGAPAVTAHPKAPRRPLDGLVAPTLLRVLTKKGLQPPASLNEKIEAAIGLCYLEYPWMPEYQPELAIYFVGRTLVEFTNEYNKDWQFFTLDNKGKQPPYIGFKADGKRFEAGLKKLEENTRPDAKFSTASNPGATKMAADLKVKTKLLLDAIGGYRATDAARVEELTRWVDTHRPKTGYPFKTLKSPEIALD